MTTEQKTMRSEYPEETAPSDIRILNLQLIHLQRFAFVMKTLVENDLLDEAVEHLHSRGCDLLAISVEPIEAIQAMLRDRNGAQSAAADTAPDPRIDTFLASGCGHPVYPPRPPDDWPEGPWDPPR